MTDFVLPTRQALLETLSMVVGDDATAKPCEEAGLENFSHMARFIDDNDSLVGACLADFKLSAAMGASLSMIGPAAVEDMVREGELTPTVDGNLYEIMNILSSLFMNDDTPHLRLSTVDAYAEAEVGGELAEFARKDFEVDLGKYGQGKLSFMSS